MIDAPGLVDEELARVAAGMSHSQWAEARPDRTVAFLQSVAQSTYLPRPRSLHLTSSARRFAEPSSARSMLMSSEVLER